jgi:two-component system, NarL family, sensor histidine kinase FusK
MLEKLDCEVLDDAVSGSRLIPCNSDLPISLPTDATEKRLTVYLIDDEVQIIRMVRMCLKKKGFETRAATDPKVAIREIAAEMPDVVLLDVHLGNADGLECIDGIRTAGFLGPVIVLSGDPTFATAHRAARAGADGYLMKYEADALPELVGCLARRTGRKGAVPEPMPEAARAYLATRGITEWELVLLNELAQDDATEKEIALRTGRPETAVRKGFETIRRKLGARSQRGLARMIGVLSCFGGRT